MFNKTKRKIVFTVVLSLLTLIIATMTTIYLSNVIATRSKQKETLETYVERYSLYNGGESAGENPPDNELPPLPPDDKEPKRGEAQFKLSTFYSVAYSKTGEVLKVNNGNDNMQSEESILLVASSVLSGGKTSGKKGNIYYLVSDRGGYILVAMVDGTLDNDNQFGCHVFS